MNTWELLTAPLAARLTIVLVHFLWQGALIALASSILLKLAQRQRAAVRYGITLAGLAAMAVSPVLTFCWLPPGAVLSLPVSGDLSSPAVTTLPSGVEAAAEPHRESRPVLPLFSLGRGSNEPLATRSWPRNIGASQPYLLGVWLCGVALLALRMLCGIAGVFWLRSDRTALPKDLQNQLSLVGQRFGMHLPQLVFQSQRVCEALVVGFGKPLVLLPAAWVSDLPMSALEAVIAHELAHIRRHDVIVNFLQRVLETLLFYHPATWWLSRRAEAEREMCCDELAVAMTGNRAAYAVALELVGQLQFHTPGPQLAPAIRGGKTMQLLERVRNVLDLAPTRRRGRAWTTGLVSLTVPLTIVLFLLTTAGTGTSQESGRRSNRKDPRDNQVRKTEETAREDAGQRRRRTSSADADIAGGGMTTSPNHQLPARRSLINWQKEVSSLKAIRADLAERISAIDLNVRGVDEDLEKIARLIDERNRVETRIQLLLNKIQLLQREDSARSTSNRRSTAQQEHFGFRDEEENGSRQRARYPRSLELDPGSGSGNLKLRVDRSATKTAQPKLKTREVEVEYQDFYKTRAGASRNEASEEEHAQGDLVQLIQQLRDELGELKQEVREMRRARSSAENKEDRPATGTLRKTYRKDQDPPAGTSRMMRTYLFQEVDAESVAAAFQNMFPDAALQIRCDVAQNRLVVLGTRKELDSLAQLVRLIDRGPRPAAPNADGVILEKTTPWKLSSSPIDGGLKLRIQPPEVAVETGKDPERKRNPSRQESEQPPTAQQHH